MANLKGDLSKMLKDLKSSRDADSASQAQEILNYVKQHRSERRPQEDSPKRRGSKRRGSKQRG